MKKTIWAGLFAIIVLSGGYANSEDYDYACTTISPCEFNEFGQRIKCDEHRRCHSCYMSSYSPPGLTCVTPDDPWFSSNIIIDECVGNENGHFVHGRDAGDSCKDFMLDNDRLYAKCRAVDGVYQETSLILSDYILVVEPTRVTNGGRALMTCAH